MEFALVVAYCTDSQNPLPGCINAELNLKKPWKHHDEKFHEPYNLLVTLKMAYETLLLGQRFRHTCVAFNEVI